MKSLFFILLLLSPCIAFSQNDIDKVFRNLKDGAILVRLETRKNSIEALEKHHPEKAKKIKIYVEQHNQELIDAWAKEWKYCNVYFFYAHNSQQIKKKNFTGLLMDKNLQTIASIPNLDHNYFISLWGATQKDTSSYLLGSELRMRDGGLQRVDDFGSPNMEGQENAIILLTPEFAPLGRKHPSYVRTFEKSIFERKKTTVIKKLQAKVKKYTTKL
jgi:acylphosphatase